ncbi:hypothetical protein [Kitasatospora sp. NPDC048407]|uniref:hypothetical protein n=1 Tax=Kitasatospora sp. NPDC048407 TaxID=3364051 RepID=UPI003712F1BA
MPTAPPACAAKGRARLARQLRRTLILSYAKGMATAAGGATITLALLWAQRR